MLHPPSAGSSAGSSVGPARRLGALLVLLAALSGCGGPPVGSAEGNTAPRIVSRTIAGDTYTLADHADKPAVVVFWASWCGPCRAEAPVVAKAAASYGSTIEFLSINAGEPATLVASAAPQIGIGGTVLLDSENALGRAFAVESIPLVLILDKAGIIRYRGHQLPSDLHRLLDGLSGSPSTP